MKVAVIFIIVAPSLSLQRCDHGSCELDHDYDYEFPSSADSRYERRHRFRGGIKLTESMAIDKSNNKFLNRHSHKHSTRSRYNRKKYRDDCECDCRRCNNLKQCCIPICNNECDDTSEQTNEVDDPTALGAENFVFIPFPYPVVVPSPPALIPAPLPAPVPVTTTTTTTTESTTIFTTRAKPTSSTPGPDAAATSGPKLKSKSFICSPKESCVDKETDPQKDKLMDLLLNLKHRHDLPYVPTRPVQRRHNQDYEFMHVSDPLLDRLILQRSMKGINSG